MTYGNLDDHTFAVRLELGEDVHEHIQQFCRDQGVNNAAVTALGSLDSPTLAHYSVKTKQFTDKRLDGIFEVTSLLGNVALVDGQPFAHLHVTLSDEHMRTFGGHLVKGACSATLELVIQSYPSDYSKTPDETVGLTVWDFDAN